MARGATDARGSNVTAVMTGGAQGACGRASVAVLPPRTLAIRAVLAYLVVARLGGASIAHVAIRGDGAQRAVINVWGPFPFAATVRLHVGPTSLIGRADSPPISIRFGIEPSAARCIPGRGRGNVSSL